MDILHLKPRIFDICKKIQIRICGNIVAIGLGKSLSYQDLLNICTLDTLECRKKQQSLILLLKCIRNIEQKYIRDFFSIRETSYNLGGNGVNLCVPKFNLNFMRNSYLLVRSTME